jgi:hypothetical protein
MHVGGGEDRPKTVLGHDQATLEDRPEGDLASPLPGGAVGHVDGGESVGILVGHLEESDGVLEVGLGAGVASQVAVVTGVDGRDADAGVGEGVAEESRDGADLDDDEIGAGALGEIEDAVGGGLEVAVGLRDLSTVDAEDCGGTELAEVDR